MKIALIPPRADALAFSWLGELLASNGHEVSIVEVPEIEDGLEGLIAAVEGVQALDLSHFDLLVSGSSPGWLASHRCHLIYSSADGVTPAPGRRELGHLDSVDSVLGAARTADTAAGPGVAAAFRRRLDELQLSSTSIRRIAAFSEFAATAFEDAGHGAPILISPPADPEPLAPANTPPRLVVFAESSFDGDLLPDLIDGFATIGDAHAELRISGDGPERAAVESRTADRRVRFLGELDRSAMQAELLVASSAVVLSTNAGWSTAGAAALRAGVPLVATVDSGGISEHVEHGVNGLVVEAAPERLAWAVRHIHSSPRLRWQLGLQAQRQGSVVESDRLLDVIDDLLAPAARPNVLTLSTYPVEPMIGGGQRRARFQNRAMADRCDVTVLVNTSPTDRPRRRLVEVGLSQVEVPKSPAQIEAELDIFYAMAKTPVDDITASRLSPATPAFGDELRRQLASADVVVGTQPFLIPAIPSDAPPIVHDSQNVEARLKADLLPDSVAGRWLLDEVDAVEAEAGRRAAVVTACTAEDADMLTASMGAKAAPVLVIGNGVDASALPFRTDAEHELARAELLALCGLPSDDQRPIGLFIGSWHPPNLSAARLILEAAAARPDWIFLLAGSHTSEFADEAVPDNVCLVAVFAESLLWPMIAGATAALNPMRSGGGSNLKLFDYLAVGTPIVSTLTGARGLDDPVSLCLLIEPTAQGLSDGLDRAIADLATGLDRRRSGRALVERVFDWKVLGDQWSDGILEAIGIAPGHRRTRRRPTQRPVLSSVTPPSDDPVIATMQLLGLQARLTPPSPQEVSMDPALRERLKKANDNRNIGRELPADARFAAPKRALIRVGHALTNEQVIYNQAIVEAVEQLAVSMRALESEQRELRRTVDELTAENRALQRRLEVLE